MLILFNNSDQPRDARVRVRRTALKGGSRREAEDFFHGGRFSWQGDAFLCSVKPHNFRMVAVE
jgi:hypothetical protein